MIPPRLDPRRHGRRAWAAACVAVAALVSYGAVRSERTPPAAEESVVVTGEFRADDTCAVSVDGQPIPADTTFAEVERYTPARGVPAGYTVHRLSCESLARMPGAPGVSRRGVLAVSIARKERSALAPGRYRVGPGSLERGDGTAFEAELAYPWTGAEDAPVSGIDGNVRIVRADGAGVVGSFRFVARARTPIS